MTDARVELRFFLFFVFKGLSLGHLYVHYLTLPYNTTSHYLTLSYTTSHYLTLPHNSLHYLTPLHTQNRFRSKPKMRHDEESHGLQYVPGVKLCFCLFENTRPDKEVVPAFFLY